MEIPIRACVGKLGIGSSRDLERCRTELLAPFLSVLTIFGTDTTPCRTPASENCTIVTISVGPAGCDSASAGWRFTKRQTARPARTEAHTEKNALRSKPFDDSTFARSDRNMKPPTPRLFLKMLQWANSSKRI